jgi:hypothetical protein
MNVLSTSLRRKFLILALAIELILWNPFCSTINTAALLARERVAEIASFLQLTA